MKQADPSRQLFETVTFSFMKIFNYLFEVATFLAFLFFLGDSGHKLWLKIELSGYIISSIIYPLSSIFGHSLWRESPKEKQKSPKNGYFDWKKSINFIKAKLTVSKSCLLGYACFMICYILGDAHLKNHSFLRGPSTEFIFFNFSDIATYPRKLWNQN